jgi:diaminopimelate decarboxylase
VGRCCESGDIIQPAVSLPASLKRGDIIAVLTTGAYNYSMASNYNRIPRLPIVMLHQGTHRLVVKGETLEDIIKNDI